MYEFYIDGVRLPVTPSKLEIQLKNKNKTMDLITEGEINVLKDPGLKEISFQCLLPQNQYPFAVYPDRFLSADYYITKFLDLKDHKKPFMFVVSRMTPAGKPLFETSMLVSVEDITFTEDEKDFMDVIGAVKLKQYVYYATKRLIKLEETGGESNMLKVSQERSRPVPEPPNTYTVQEGDTLWTICKTVLGEGDQYKEVAEKNSINNPNSISAGQVITLA